VKIDKILYSSRFEKSFRDLTKSVKKQALQKEAIFRAECFDPRLKTHKLQGKLQNHWSFSINHSHRILFEFLEGATVLFKDIGSHSIYR
jgi:mRNA-degrading endonuclease YafQ of YafQ-DinJ toxin-antitoxin module